MKTFKKIIAFTLALSLLMIGMIMPAIAQDSTATGPQVVDTFFGLHIPVILQTVIVVALMLLPVIQLVLKRIPSTGSIKIQGALGKILDLLTFFQKDKIKPS